MKGGTFFATHIDAEVNILFRRRRNVELVLQPLIEKTQRVTGVI